MNITNQLNQDPLAQLKDIQLPEPIGIWPPAPGWWILAFVCIGLAGFITWKYLHYKKQQQYRKIAIKFLESEKSELVKHKDLKRYLQNISTILRRTALTAYSNQGIEPLQGEEWLKFLDSKMAEKVANKKHLSFVNGDAKKIITLPYQNIDKTNISSKELASIHMAILFWIKYHPTQNAAENAEEQAENGIQHA
ncbi:MAG: DUF4381 domain-containing protein [Cellvibrionaceae bacterium]